jgi:cytochrome c biogenesis protein CcmG, thiol:disulfide interchange protein DsbE
LTASRAHAVARLTGSVAVESASGLRDFVAVRRLRLIAIVGGTVLAGLICALAVLANIDARRSREAAAAVPAPLAIGTELQRPRRLPDVPLVSASGRSTSPRAWRGKWVVLAPSMTLCHEVCPVTTGVLIQLTRQIRAAGLSNRVVVAEATVDPWRDTPARLRAYQRLTGADFSMLTGSRAAIHQLWRFLGVFYKRVPQGNPPDIDWLNHTPETFDVEHTDAVFIIDPAGQERVEDVGMPKLTGRLSAQLHRLLDRDGDQNLAHPELPWSSSDVVDDLLHVMDRTIPAPAAPKSGPAPTAADARQALVGSPAALASLHRQAGTLITAGQMLGNRLGQLRGHPVVINAWASSCGPCQAEFSLFATASARYGRRVAFIGADTNDSAGSARSFLAHHPISYPSYPTTSAALTPWANIEGLPTTIYLSASGKVLNVHTGEYDSLAALENDVQHYALKING